MEAAGAAQWLHLQAGCTYLILHLFCCTLFLCSWEAQQAAQADEAAEQASQAHEKEVDEFIARQEGLSQSDLAERQAQAGGQRGAVGHVYGRSLMDSDKGKLWKCITPCFFGSHEPTRVTLRTIVRLSP